MEGFVSIPKELDRNIVDELLFTLYAEKYVWQDAPTLQLALTKPAPDLTDYLTLLKSQDYIESGEARIAGQLYDCYHITEAGISFLEHLRGWSKARLF